MELADIDDADADERANRRKRDALRGDKPVQFSMFDPVVAYDAIFNNWINVAEVAKLGIQAAHKKLSVAREERVELQISLDNLRQQLRGMQEHHVQQMDILKIRLEILEKIAKRKKKYRNGKVPTTEQLEHLPNKLRSRGGERETLGGRGPPSKDPRASAGLRVSAKSARGSDRRTQGRDSLSHFLSQEEDGSSSDDSSVRGVTQDQQQLLEKIEPMRNLIDELKTSLRKESRKSDALHKQIVKGQHHQDQLENRMNDELSTRALSLLFRQVVFADLPAMLETFVQEKFQVFRKTTDGLERKVEAEVGHRKQVVEAMDKKLGALISRVASTEEGIQTLAAKFSSQESSNLSEVEDRSPYAAASSQSYREALLSRSDLHPDLQPELSEGIETQLLDVQQGAGAEGNVAQDSLAEDTAQLAQAADDMMKRASLPLPIPARHVPSTSNSHDPSQATEQSGAGEGSRTGTLEEIALPRTLDPSESHFSPSEHFWGPPSMEDPEVDHPRAGLSDASSSRFFPRNKSRTSAEGSSHASPKSTKTRDGASTRRRSAARMEKAVTRKQTEDVNDDLSPSSSLNLSHLTEGGGRNARRTSRLVQKAEDALSALFRMKGGGKDGGDKSMSLDDFTTNMANMSTMQDTLKAQKEDGDRLHEEVSDLSSRLGALEETVKKLAESVSQVRELADLRQQENQSRLSNVEGRSDGEFQRVIQLAEDRVMAFLRESEMERARLWHQMAVLFPRFIQDEEDGAEKMTLTEARMFALDVRLDTLEGGIVRLLAREPDCMPKPRKRHTRRIQPDPENGGIKRSSSPQQPKRCSTPGTNRSPSPLQQKRGSTPGDDGDCATRASVSPSSSPEPRPLQLPTLDQVAKPGSHTKLRELLAMQQELVHQVSDGDAGRGPSDRRSSAVQGSELLARIAAIPEDPEWQNVRHPPSRESLEGAVLDVLEEARSAYDDAAEAMRSLGSAHPNSGRWRAGDAAVGRVLEQEQGINNQSAKQRKASQPWSPPYRPFRPLDHLRSSS